ncbi:MAG: hypothetical protein JWL63_3509 [Rhodocyclales bacterium]|nr:hypothetical protein [Rhodocyclales bacterium]
MLRDDWSKHRHPGESRDPGSEAPYWIPAFAGMTYDKWKILSGLLDGIVRRFVLCEIIEYRAVRTVIASTAMHQLL